MEPAVPAGEEGARPDSFDGSAGGVFRNQELCRETEAEEGRVLSQLEPFGMGSGELLQEEGAALLRAEGGGTGSELSLEVRPEAGTPAIRIWCFILDKAGG